VTVPDELAGLTTGHRKPEAVDNVIETTLEQERRFSPVTPFWRAAFSK